MTYRDLAGQAIKAFASASERQLKLQVPWTPLWDGKDVLAHLVETADHAVAGGVGPRSDQDAHEAVLGLRPVSVADLLELWAGLAAEVPIPPMGPSAEWDLAVHLTDLHEVWRLEVAPTWWSDVLDSTLTFLDETGHLDHQIATKDQSWGSGERLFVSEPYELFRAIFGRRTEAELQPFVGRDSARIVAMSFF